MSEILRATSWTLLALALGLSTLAAALRAGEEQPPTREAFFEAKIRPVLAGTCFTCHNDRDASGGLRVDSREALLKGGESGQAITPGRPDESRLLRAIERQDEVSPMPPDKDMSLRADQVADFRAWIADGAPWPAAAPRFAATRHWAFEPLSDAVSFSAATSPRPGDAVWAQSGIDPFIRARQEASGDAPAPPAAEQTLIRRATFDLTGLPPTPLEVEAFVSDDSPAAFAKVIDRLLASPAYGEQWGRHWLDVVRYADTAGETADYPVPQAWKYRNYVIDSFRADKPYDTFLREQVAGDVLANDALATGGPRENYAEQVTATGFLAISRRFGFDSENYHHLTIQDTIDTLGQAVLGLSLGCARCHDHKFDPVSMEDYYALYGIFASSRYPFPGSEQKQRIRALVPLIPPSESRPLWREQAVRAAAMAERLAMSQQAVPQAVLGSLHEIDGDFELQAPAAGGSYGVLVPPWLSEGKIAVTNAAQSPFQHAYPGGKVGASVPVDAGAYRIWQALQPRRTQENCRQLHVNLDFRTQSADASATGQHRLSLGELSGDNAVEVLISTDAVALKFGECAERLASLQPGQWHNLQLVIDVAGGTVCGSVGTPAATVAFQGQPLASSWGGVIDVVRLDATGAKDARYAAIEFDNLAVQDAPIAVVSTNLVANQDDRQAQLAAITSELQALTGFDGDFELQTVGQPPAAPWNAGPNSVVKLEAESQSPLANVYPAGALGIHMPNRGEYDGFGLTLPAVKASDAGQLHVGFDFRCASQEAGGAGSWRYYLGHGPGHSAAVELFWNGSEFFARSGDERAAVGTIKIGQWYQVRLTLDLPAKRYHGALAWLNDQEVVESSKLEGQFATGWDGAIDYAFIDSYGHLAGVRPALDADNFVLADAPLRPLDAAPLTAEENRDERRAKAAALRGRIADLQSAARRDAEELAMLLADGPTPLAYAMSEGTPHDARLQLRGEPDDLADQVPRGFLKVLGGGPLPPETIGSGRRELAAWLSDAGNPLTARVMANRVWQHLFGQGLVATPNDFGMRGRRPTNRELLDHLATRLVRDGWSIKRLQVEIMLSASYQQAATAQGEPQESTSRQRRRLSAEEIRDAILAVSGELDLAPGREHPFPPSTSWGFTQHTPFSATYDHRRRSVYLMTQRLKRHPFLALFDGADPSATTPVRLPTTVPTQALYFLNDPFVHAASEAWARRLIAVSGDASERTAQAIGEAFGRAATLDERSEALDFLAAYRQELAAAGLDSSDLPSLAAFLRTLIGSNEFLYVD